MDKEFCRICHKKTESVQTWDGVSKYIVLCKNCGVARQSPPPADGKCNSKPTHLCATNCIDFGTGERCNCR